VFLNVCTTILFLLPLTAGGDSTPHETRLKRLVKSGRDQALHDFIVEMGRLDTPESVRLIPAAAVRVASGKNYRTALEAVAQLQHVESVAELISLLQKEGTDYREKILLLEAFGHRRDSTTLEEIFRHFDGKESLVVIAALRAATTRQAKETVPALIDLLERTWSIRDRVWLEARQALFRLTGQDYDNIEDWRKFWETVKARFDPRESRDTDRRTRVARSKDSVEFFGGAIFSGNVVFLIDVSASMIKWDLDERYRGRNVARARQRLARVRRELAKTFKNLSRKARFNVIAFSDTVYSWQHELKPATRNNLASAASFVSKFVPSGDTHTDEALQKAFSDPSVDTIVFLSDGAPDKRTSNTPTLIIEILQWLEDNNASRKVRIETFGFVQTGNWPRKIPGLVGRRPPIPTETEVQEMVEFLKTLASYSGGTFRPIE